MIRGLLPFSGLAVCARFLATFSASPLPAHTLAGAH
jgi:hypothetical protein